MTVEHLERILAPTWPGLERDQVGDWLLRAGRGVTSRANSALVLGDPGRPHEDALDAVVVASGTWVVSPAADRGLRASRGGRGMRASGLQRRHSLGHDTVCGPRRVRRGPSRTAAPCKLSRTWRWSGRMLPPSTTDRDRAAEQTATPALYATLCVGGAAVGLGSVGGGRRMWSRH